jgi:cell division protein FtsB
MIQNDEDTFDLNEKVLITFKNEEYILNAYALLSKDGGLSSNESLVISITKESTNEIWKGKYTNNYVEEITKKTGNFKKFSIFIEMLFSAIKMSSKTVALDLLTLEDVQKLKENSDENERIGTADSNRSNKSSRKKLFLILTYSAAFDRVHYPLPLTFQGFEDEMDSIAVVEKLEKEIENLKNEKDNNINEISKLLRENDKLKYEVKQLQDLNQGSTLTVFNNAFEEKIEFNLNRVSKFVNKEFDVILKLYKQKKMQSLMKDKLVTLQKYVLKAFTKYEKDKKKLEKELKEKNNEIDELKKKVKNLQIRKQNFSNEISSKSLSKQRSTSLTKQRSTSIPSINKEVKSSGYNKPSGYNIIKSKPLKPSYLMRDKNKRSTSKVSRNSSVSSFKRFDPTAYVREREQKLEERRARSREISKSRFSRNNSLGVISNASSSRSLSKNNLKSSYSSGSLYVSRSKSIDRNTMAKKKMNSEANLYGSRYNRSSSTMRNSASKISRNSSVSKISQSSTIKRSASRVINSRDSSLTNIKNTRDNSLGRKISKTNISYINIPKNYSNSKISQRNRLGYDSNSFISSSKTNKALNGKTSKLKTKLKEKISLKNNLYDNKPFRPNSIDNESQYLYDSNFEDEVKTENYNLNEAIITEKDNQWENSYNINDIDARLEAIQKYLKDTQDEF